MRRHMIYNASLHDSLIALPIYGDYECAGIEGQCTRPACIRHPMSGKFYCSGHALELAESHPVDLSDISIALGIRKRMLDEAWECSECDKPAERICSYCQVLLCFDHMKYIPRDGACCDDCALALEQEAEAQGKF
jgi:hypothetical protein